MAALRFREALGKRVTVELYDGLDHLGAAQDERLYAAACAWLAPGMNRAFSPDP
jgi:hypothetical protein